MVDIINIGLAIDKTNEIFNNLDDVFLSENSHLVGCSQTKLLVDAESTHITQVITLLAEEQVVDDLACTSVIGWLGVAQLTINVVDSLLLAVTCVFVKSVEYDLIFTCIDIFLVQEYSLYSRVKNLLNVVLLDDSVAVKNHVITLDSYNLTGILVNEVLVPRLENTCSEFAAHSILEVSLVHFNLLGKTEDFDDVVIGLQTNRPEKSCYWQFLLAVDVSIHHVVDVGSKLNPAAPEWDDSR